MPDRTPHAKFMRIVTANLVWLRSLTGIKVDDAARVLVMAIAGQESEWEARKQYGGPARSFWQFEQGGGVHGVLTHPASSLYIKLVCDELYIECTESTVFEAMAWNDRLATAMARLLLYTDPGYLPLVGSVDQAWDYYERNWRPGAPRPEVWPDRYATSRALL
jgi:hypothetical protein